MADATVVAVGPSFTSGAGAPISPQVPTEAQGAFVGCVAFAEIRDQSGTSTADVTPPSGGGWARVGGAFTSSQTSTRVTSVWWKALTKADLGSTPTWTAQSTNTRKLARVIVMKNVDVSSGTPIASQTGYLLIGTNPTQVPALANSANQVVLETFVAEYTANNSTKLGASTTVPIALQSTDYRAANGGVSQASEDLSVSRSVQYVWVGKAGSSGLGAHVIQTGTPTNPVVQQFVLKSTASEQVPPSTTPPRRPHSMRLWINQKVVTPRVRMSDGTIRTAQLLYLIPRLGYASVAAMQSMSEFWIAHRGGSDSYPEMSSYAYLEAAMLGYGAMELSLAKTSDGVLFGMHDASLDRTSLGVSGNTLVASSMTWAQVQTYKIRGDRAKFNPTQPDQPYMTFTDYLKYHQQRCVTFIDPKAIYDVATLNQILDIMDANGGPAKFVAKYFGVVGQGPTTWMGLARARGYKSWGFFYDDTAASDVTTYAPYYDYVGMNYNAPDSAVAALKAASRSDAKLIAHITPDAAAVNSARAWTSWKPSGFMVSGAVPVAAANNVKVP